MSRNVRWLVAILVALTIAYGAWNLVRTTRDAARIRQTKQNLTQIGLALHSYHEKYDCFPPAYVLGPDEKPWHSWRVLLPPFLGEDDLYAQYRWDEPWDGPHNRELQARRPKVYASPLQKSREPNIATYLGVVSRRTMYIADARQTIQFRLDEYGAELISDTQSHVADNGHGPSLEIDPLKPRHFIFDRPFLLVLRERQAESPYFLAWIGNADLMLPMK